MAQTNMEADFTAAIESGKINGATVCATDSKGLFNYTKTLGQRTLLSGESKPFQPDDVLYLASSTKLLATIAALKCVEDGILSLSGDLYGICPELAAKQVLVGWSEDGQTPLLEPQVRPITLEMLLTHSAGIAYHFIDPNLAKWHEKFGPSAQESNKGQRFNVEELLNHPLTFQPGTNWAYGTNLDWAGRIVERATGQTLHGYLQQHVFAPLGITDARFFDQRMDLKPRLANLSPDDPQAFGASSGASGSNAFTKGDFGGHGLYMTAEDYVKVLRSLLANDGKILKPVTVDSMFEPHLHGGAAAAHEAALESPMGVMYRLGTAPGSKAGFGYGGLLSLEDAKGFYGERTLAWGGGMTMTWFVDRKNDICGFGSVNCKIPVDIAAATELKQVLREDIYRKRDAWRQGQTS